MKFGVCGFVLWVKCIFWYEFLMNFLKDLLEYECVEEFILFVFINEVGWLINKLLYLF